MFPNRPAHGKPFHQAMAAIANPTLWSTQSMNMRTLTFDNRFVAEVSGDNGPPRQPRQVKGAAWSHAVPTPVRAPKVLAHAHEVATLLGLSAADVDSPWFAQVFSGNRLVPGMQPYAACYGGHQVGNWAGQLGAIRPSRTQADAGGAVTRQPDPASAGLRVSPLIELESTRCLWPVGHENIKKLGNIPQIALSVSVPVSRRMPGPMVDDSVADFM